MHVSILLRLAESLKVSILASNKERLAESLKVSILASNKD